MVSSKTASPNWASTNVDPDNTAFLNTAPRRLAFPKLTRSRTAFEKFTPTKHFTCHQFQGFILFGWLMVSMDVYIFLGFLLTKKYETAVCKRWFSFADLHRTHKTLTQREHPKLHQDCSSILKLRKSLQKDAKKWVTVSREGISRLYGFKQLYFYSKRELIASECLYK